MLRLELPGAATAGLHHELAGLDLAAPPDDVGSATVLARLFQIAAGLPLVVVAGLLAFRADPGAPAALLLSGLPIDQDLPATPTGDARPPYKPGRVSDLAILSIAMLLGEPVAYRAEKRGALVQNVFPTRAQRDTPSNESSSAALGFHTELTFHRDAPAQPFHVAAPDFVLLLGLRCPADRRATTIVAPVRELCAELTLAELAALREPEFQLMAPYSFTRDGDGGRPWSTPVAVLRGPADAPSLAFDTACGVRALTPGGQVALDALARACADPRHQDAVQLDEGDLLVINNTRCAHARGSFPAQFDGRDRWLQRAYVRHGIWPHPAASSESFRVLR